MKHLGRLIANWRWVEKLTAREAAEMIGLTPSTYSRLERGYSVDGGTLAIVLMWLLQPGAVGVELPCPINEGEKAIMHNSSDPALSAAPAESLDVDSEAAPAEAEAR